MASPTKEHTDLSAFLRDIQAESDRGAALVATSKLEDRLGEIIASLLIEDETSRELLKGKYAPLGSFSSRINAAFALGLIEQAEFAECQIIRRIRNKFAHSSKALKFDSPEVRDLVLNLPNLLPPDTEPEPRQLFIMAVAFLTIDLMWRAKLVSKERRTTKTWANKLRGSTYEEAV